MKRGQKIYLGALTGLCAALLLLALYRDFFSAAAYVKYSLQSDYLTTIMFFGPLTGMTASLVIGIRCPGLNARQFGTTAFFAAFGGCLLAYLLMGGVADMFQILFSALFFLPLLQACITNVIAMLLWTIFRAMD